MSKKKFENVETTIGPNTIVRGDIEVTGSIRIDGTLHGNTQADWVTVGEKGSVDGDINAKGVILAGLVKGTITATEKIELNRTGRAKGDLAAPKLVVEEGGVLDGRSFMGAGKGPGEPDSGADAPKPEEAPAP